MNPLAELGIGECELRVEVADAVESGAKMAVCPQHHEMQSAEVPAVAMQDGTGERVLAVGRQIDPRRDGQIPRHPQIRHLHVAGRAV